MEVFKNTERRDPGELLPTALPEPIAYKSQREYVRKVLEAEVDFRTHGTRFIDKSAEPQRTLDYRNQLNSEGSPSQTVAAGYQWAPGTELNLQPQERAAS
jgi:hypothetical protein